MKKPERKIVPQGDPRFAFLEHGDDGYKPMIPIRVTEKGQVFAKSSNRVVLLRNVTVQDVEDLVRDRGHGEYQQYDAQLIGMDAFELAHRSGGKKIVPNNSV